MPPPDSRDWQAPSLPGSHVCLARKSESESEAATGSLFFGLGVTRGDHNHDMSDSFKLTPGPANTVASDLEAAAVTL